MSGKRRMAQIEKSGSEDVFDSNAISPGTAFMERVNEMIQYYISLRMSTDPAWKKEIYQGFENEENDTPEEVWEFSHQDILDIQKYIDDNGLGDMNGEGYLDKFYQEFAPRCQTEYHADRIGY